MSRGRLPDGRPAKRSLGQNFLIDRGIQARIVEALGADPASEVLEIGPGGGALTGHLEGRVRLLLLVELDDALAAELDVRFRGREDVRALHRDFLELDRREVAEDPSGLLVIGNIPYSITTPILFRLLAPPRPRRIVVMVQEEVADRILAEPGGKEYGALSVGVQSVAQVERVLRVPRGAFRPVPRVDSAVLRITPIDPSPLTEEEAEAFRALVRALFQWRRKKLGTILREHPGLGGTGAAGADPREAGRRRIEQARAAGLDPDRRPEVFSPGELLTLLQALSGAGDPGAPPSTTPR